MSTFIALAIGILIGTALGAMGMFFLIQETQMDLIQEERAYDFNTLEQPWEAEELEMPKEVK